MKGFVFFIAVLALLMGYLYFQVNFVTVRRYTVSIQNLPAAFEGLTILHLSDFHNKKYGKQEEKLIRLINAQDFDFVAITGDLIDKRKPNLEPIKDLLENLSGEKVYFVPGNHEWQSGYSLKELLAPLGVISLENKADKYVRGEAYLWIVGVDDPYLRKADLEKALENTDNNAPKILLAHAPNIFPSAVENKLDLVLTGHTHGGQVRIPFLGALVIPGQGFFPGFDYGLYTRDTTTMIINGGLGESVFPLRINNRPEIVLVTLRGE
ncbi:MAG TPA: metallophosphoesterase [Clostridia bacterium]|nr:metallophosphoesterase [Clostridia bacterium]